MTVSSPKPMTELASQMAAISAALIDAQDFDSAMRAITKGDTVRYWQKVFSSTFDA